MLTRKKATNLLETVDNVFMGTSKIFATYFFAVSIFFIFGKKKEKPTSQRLKFAALIAARNEEDSISGIIESLKKQKYPEGLIDIFVIPNNCTDRTGNVARSSGAYIIEAPKNIKDKGAALQLAINKLLPSEKQYDAFLVVDADNEVSPNFVLSLNQTLCNGSRVAKSRILAKNPQSSWLAMCYDIHFCTANLFLNRARARVGLSARLIGTGFAVTRDYLQEIGGFNTVTITEDAEFFAICAARGEKIAFCENAITYEKQRLDFKRSLIQRKRWMSGIMQVLILKFPDLGKGLLRKKSAKYSLDTLIQFSFAYLQALLPFVLLLRMVNSPGLFMLKFLPLMILKAYLYILFITLVVLLFERRLSYSKNVIMGILLYPFFVGSFIPLQTLSLFKRTVKWEEKKSPPSKGWYFRGARKFLRLFFNQKMMVDEKIFLKENVLIGHHQNFYGPISCFLYLPDTVNIWVASHLFTSKECFNMYYNFTFKETIKLPRVPAFILALLGALLIPPILKSAGAIPVYRQSRNIMKTLNQSIELLNKGQQILIFPDVEYNDHRPEMGKIYTGFTYLEKLYYRSKKEHLAFVPILTDKKTGTITNLKPIYFKDDKSYRVAKDIFVNHLIGVFMTTKKQDNPPKLTTYDSNERIAEKSSG